MPKTKLNCWEFLKCGREPGGAREKDLGICPAATESRLNGIHDGKNAGRACWVVSGTLCSGCVHGTFAQKFPTCEMCDFYYYVKQRESRHNRFKLSSTLLSILKS
jgi:hypothetical protein